MLLAIRYDPFQTAGVRIGIDHIGKVQIAGRYFDLPGADILQEFFFLFRAGSNKIPYLPGSFANPFEAVCFWRILARSAEVKHPLIVVKIHQSNLLLRVGIANISVC